MAKKMSSGKGSKSDQSESVYGLTARRELCLTGDTYVCVNSRALSTVIPPDQLPSQIVDVKYTKKGMKITEGPVNAERMLTSNGRRHQMRLSTHMDTGARPKKDQNGKVSAGTGIVMSGGGLY